MKGSDTKEGDFLEHLFAASTHDYLLFFTNRGRVYWLKVYEIPDAATVGKGKHISNLINLQPDETVTVTSEVAGRVKRVNYDFGQAVRRGQVVAELDTTSSAFCITSVNSPASAVLAA